MTARPLIHMAPTPFLEDQPITGIVAGRLDDPGFAAFARAFFDARCGGPVKLGPPAPKRSYDHSVSKEENQRRAMAEIDAAFERGMGR